MFTIQKPQHIHMCCVCNRNTEGCQRVRVSHAGVFIGYVMFSEIRGIPENFTYELAPGPTEIKLRTGVADNTAKVTVIPERDNGIAIGFEGFGQCEMYPGPGAGQCVYIEFVKGVPRLHVWGDIQDPDVTDTISLENACESRRLPDEEYESDND